MPDDELNRPLTPGQPGPTRNPALDPQTRPGRDVRTGAADRGLLPGAAAAALSPDFILVADPAVNGDLLLSHATCGTDAGPAEPGDDLGSLANMAAHHLTCHCPMVTATGTVLTGRQLDALAAEADAGYVFHPCPAHPVYDTGCADCTVTPAAPAPLLPAPGEGDAAFVLAADFVIAPIEVGAEPGALILWHRPCRVTCGPVEPGAGLPNLVNIAVAHLDRHCTAPDSAGWHGPMTHLAGVIDLARSEPCPLWLSGTIGHVTTTDPAQVTCPACRAHLSTSRAGTPAYPRAAIHYHDAAPQVPCQCPAPGTYAAPPTPPAAGRFPDAKVFGPPPGGEWPGASDPSAQFTVPLGEAPPENLAAAMGQPFTSPPGPSLTDLSLARTRAADALSGGGNLELAAAGLESAVAAYLAARLPSMTVEESDRMTLLAAGLASRGAVLDLSARVRGPDGALLTGDALTSAVAAWLTEHDVDPDTGEHAESLSPHPGPAATPAADAPRLLRVALRLLAVRDAELTAAQQAAETANEAVWAVGARWLMAAAGLAHALLVPSSTTPSYVIVREWLADRGIDPDHPPGGPAGDDTGWIVPGLIAQEADAALRDPGRPPALRVDTGTRWAEVGRCPDRARHSAHEWDGGTRWCEGVEQGPVTP